MLFSNTNCYLYTFIAHKKCMAGAKFPVMVSSGLFFYAQVVN